MYDETIEIAIGSLLLSSCYRHHYDYENGFGGLLLNLIIQTNPNFVYEIIDKEDSEKNSNFERVVAKFINSTNAEDILQKLLKLPNGKIVAFHTFQYLKQSESKDQQTAYEMSKKYLQEEHENHLNIISDYQEKNLIERSERVNKLYEEFKFKLKPEEGRYYLEVFEFYQTHKETLVDKISKEDLERLKYLVEDVLKNYDFESSKVTQKEEGEGKRTTTFSGAIVYFGQVLLLVKELDIDISTYREKIIRYIPFAYNGHNSLSPIFDLIPSITEEDVTYLTSFYQSERSDDLHTANISNLLSTIKKYEVIGLLPLIKNILRNQKFKDSHYEFLTFINEQEPDYELNYHILNSSSHTESVREIASDFLITQYNPYRLKAIRHRLNQINKKIKEYDPSIHGTGNDYHDINYFYSDRSRLDNVRGIELLEDFLNLFKASLNILAKGKEYSVSAEYAWDVVFKYLDNAKVHKSLEPLNKLKELIDKSIPATNNEWLIRKYEGLRQSYNEVCKPSSLNECISIYRSLKDRQYKQITTSHDLKNIILDTIDENIRKWIEQEGAYKIMNSDEYKIISAGSNSSNPKSLFETLIQKTIIPQFAFSLTKRGLRPADVQIRREEQLLDDQRTDFTVSYGFVGNVLIEIKLTKNDEVKSPKAREAYKNKLIKYVEGTNSDYGIFLIFQIDSKNSLELLMPVIENLYDDVVNIDIVGVDCTASKN